MLVGIIGMGCVGKAMYKSFQLKEVHVYCYDINININYKYHELEELLETEFIFV